MSYKVIDISEHNASVDFSKLKVDAVILRVGYRGYGDEGKLMLDKKFKQYIKQANACHIPVGVYFYSQATTLKEAKDEAQFVVKNLRGFKVDLPVYFDVEYAECNGNFVGRLYKAKISKSKLTNIAKAFCDVIKIYGYEAGIYANYDFFKNKLELVELRKYSLWIAHYSAKSLPKLSGATFDMWQYTDDGKMVGITGMVDMDNLYTDLIWRDYTTTTNLHYRNATNLSSASLKGTLKANTPVVVKSGSTVYENGYEWVKIKLDRKDEATYYVAKQYLRSV